MACETRRGPLQLQVRNVEKLMRHLSILVHSGSTIYVHPLTAGQLRMVYLRHSMIVGHPILHLLLPVRGAVAVVESLEVATLLGSLVRVRNQSGTQIGHFGPIAIAPKCL